MIKNLKKSKINKICSGILFIGSIYWLTQVSPSWAQSLTPTSVLTTKPTSKPTTQSATSESQAVEAIRKDVEEKIQQELQQTTQLKRGFFGKISDLYNQTIVVETSEGKKTAKVDKDTILVDQSNKKINFEDLAIDSYVIVMGNLETTDKLLVTRLVVTPKPKETNRLALIGRVAKIIKNKITLQLLKDSSSLEANITSKTKINQKVDSKITQVDLANVDEQTLVVVAGIKQDDQVEAKVIYLLEEKNTSPIPSISASPSKTPNPTKIPSTAKSPTPTTP